MQGVAILGSTGSIGASTLDVLGRHPQSYRVVALGARRDHATLFAQCKEHRPRYAVLVEEDAARQLRERLKAEGLKTEVLSGSAALADIAGLESVDTVMAAIVGAAGLAPTMAAVQSGKRVLLANKEALVLGGRWFMEAVAASGAELLPIDSEHNALFQCMPPGYRCGKRPQGLRRIVLTASGGPFRTWSAEQIAAATPDQACAHPKWRMGRKISVDSATLMNKGLEVIEAHWLFGLPAAQIEVVIHPQSVVHSLVDYVDGSMLAQLGNPDMRTPIAQALAWPARVESGVPSLDLAGAAAHEFYAPDHQRFPCLGHAYAALRAEGGMPAVLNAANEIAVAAFLDGRVGFAAIAALIDAALARYAGAAADDLDAALALDADVRDWTLGRVGGEARA